ncbi:hypothetical protein VYU27_001757 [Nannochloropsis oceanica]
MSECNHATVTAPIPPASRASSCSVSPPRGSALRESHMFASSGTTISTTTTNGNGLSSTAALMAYKAYEVEAEDAGMGSGIQGLQSSSVITPLVASLTSPVQHQDHQQQQPQAHQQQQQQQAYQYHYQFPPYSSQQQHQQYQQYQQQQLRQPPPQYQQQQHHQQHQQQQQQHQHQPSFQHYQQQQLPLPPQQQQEPSPDPTSDSMQYMKPDQLVENLVEQFWASEATRIRQIDPSATDLRLQELPLARVKKVMKQDEEVHGSPKVLISMEALVIMAKACELFLLELTLRGWQMTKHNARRTLQRVDLAQAIIKCDVFDFLIDIVPRDQAIPTTRAYTRHAPAIDAVAIATDDDIGAEADGKEEVGGKGREGRVDGGATASGTGSGMWDGEGGGGAGRGSCGKEGVESGGGGGGGRGGRGGGGGGEGRGWDGEEEGEEGGEGGGGGGGRRRVH